ncbi:hypothetical protein HNP55_001973 [Paucibacter oligotrophus]|uniref:Uncharacterized protein n=1 Tax=Roseateles oligotrophus TaxID=1769250 RepID=A0A840L4I5_9BURK|nr:hypothetical protein [Roseateles oligotrophus]
MPQLGPDPPPQKTLKNPLSASMHKIAGRLSRVAVAWLFPPHP